MQSIDRWPSDANNKIEKVEQKAIDRTWKYWCWYSKWKQITRKAARGSGSWFEKSCKCRGGFLLNSKNRIKVRPVHPASPARGVNRLACCPLSTTAGPLGLLLGTDIPVRLAITVVPLACLPVAGSQGHPFKFRQSDPPVRATGWTDWVVDWPWD